MPGSSVERSLASFLNGFILHNMDVSIIILNYKTKELIKQQLKHFFSFTSTLTFEVVVVDNHSEDGIAAFLRETYPGVRCLEAPDNRGYAAGNNIGLRASSGTYSLIVNPDIVLNAELVEGLYRFMETNPKVGIAGPKLVNADGSLQPSCLRFPDVWLPLYRRTFFSHTPWGRGWLARYFMEEFDHTQARDVDWLFGACLMVRTAALAQVGLLDERFFLYLEDTDWCRRFWEKGHEVWYVPEVSTVHLLSRSSEGAPLTVFTNRTARIHLRSFFKYLVKFWGKPNPHGSES
ncbi:MAG: glycosyltransferase family 2 protein [Candidatus Komeilibacteria bacterium]|nr:glycosyltransferase family 2 protein [Candidatus Komeilibacteria bacterium]